MSGPGKKSFFSPFKLWKNFLKKPNTIRYPYEDIDVFGKVGAAPEYRGFHYNDHDLCIGCGTCQEVCTTDAIRMVEGTNIGPGKLGKVPEIDYGRCCYCGFCVDVCTTGSISMSRHYLGNYPTPVDKIGQPEVDDLKEHFTLTPEMQYSDEPGHMTSGEQSWLGLERETMGELPANERWDSFIEIVKGYSREAALAEASRCVECGVCVETCPANMRVPQYIRAIWDGDLERSVKEMYVDNPLPGICGRVCTHKCETVCSIGHRGDPVAIRWLKRYAIDNLPSEKIAEIAGQVSAKPKTGKNRVAIVGSGPAGLSAAYYLGGLGYKVTIYDSNKKPGGVMRYGIPKYRLPDSGLDRDIEIVKALGIEIKTGVRVGKDIPFAKIKASADAVMIATGFDLPRSTKIPGIDGKNCYQAFELLKLAAEGGDVPLGKKILVIGGGNVAFDIARTLARLQRAKQKKADLTMICLESGKEIPADIEEVIESKDEGIVLNEGRMPKEVVFKSSKLAGLRHIKCTRVFDESGRFAPLGDESDTGLFEADMVVEAVGQQPDYTYLPDETAKKLEIVRGRILTDENGGTDIPWLFAAGDIVHGPDIIHAVRDGHNTARAIDKFLNGGK